MVRRLLERLLDPNENTADLIIGLSENFQLEFKSRNDPKSSKLTKSDKQSLSKEIGGFLNAEGGLLLFGVVSETIEKQDIATKLQEFDGISRLRSVVQGSLSELVTPIHPGIKVHAIQTSEFADKGILAIEVPASTNKPHTSTAPEMHRHYRRGIEGTHIMDNGQIRDCVLAQRSAEFGFEIKMSLGSGQPEPWIRKISLTIELKNVSSVAAISPFIEVISTPQMPQIAEGKDVFQRRHMMALHQHGYYSGADCVLHAGASMDVCKFEFYISTYPSDFDTYFGTDANGHLSDYMMARDIKILQDEWGDTHTHLVGGFDKFELRISCGAINVVRELRHFECAQNSIMKDINDYVVGLKQHLELSEVT